MKLHQLVENIADLKINYSETDKFVLGGAKAWVDKLGASKKDIADAMALARKLPSFESIKPFDITSSKAASVGTFQFAKAGRDLGIKDKYMVYANGQVRGTSGPKPHKLKSPKPMVKGETPVDVLVNIYDEAFKQVGKLLAKAHTPIGEDELPTTKEEVIKRLKALKIKNYTINDDLSVDVNGSVELYNKRLKAIPVQFGEVTGSFDIRDNYFINSLKGCPRKIGSNFLASKNAISSLKFAPKEIGGTFSVSNCALTSLVGSPREISGAFDCDNNKQLTNLVGAPREVGKGFYCQNCDLESYDGAPKIVGGSFIARGNPRADSAAIKTDVTGVLMV